MGNLPLQSEWIWDFLRSPIPLYITYTLTAFAFIVHPFLFGLHIHRKIIKSSKKDVPPSNPKRPSIKGQNSLKSLRLETDESKLKLIHNVTTITTLISLMFGWVSSIITFVNTSSTISSPSTCGPISILQNCCWVITKLTIYQVLILRLQAAFWRSVHEYNRTLMLSVYIFVTMVSVLCIVGSMVQIKSIHFHDGPTSHGWCLLIVPTWLILLPCALDVVCSVFVTYLFIRVLKKLLARNPENITKNKSLLNVTVLMSKLVLLIIIAVSSNLFGGLWFAVTDIALFTYLDTIINPVCLVLMESRHSDIYRFCCKFCHIGMHRIIHRNHPELACMPFGNKGNENKLVNVVSLEKTETATERKV